jgi:proteasome assembly chaperone (PAC2) family protein
MINLYETPDLKKASFIAAWPGMGNVALTAVNYLREKLGAKLLGEIPPADYFAQTDAIVEKQIIRPPEPPINQFYYYKSRHSQNDILFFIGSVQPISHREYAFAGEILKFAQNFGTKIIYTTAAAPSDMNFHDKSRVFAVPNNRSLLKKLMEYRVHFMSEGVIAGLNGLLLSVAAEMGLKGVCLLGEIPFYTAQLEFPKASLSIVEVLTKLLNVTIDMVDLELFVTEKEKEIESVASLLMKGEESEDEEDHEKFIPKTESTVPRAVRLRIEKLFRQAELDQTYKSKMRLKEELDKWELFNDFLDRFLDLFKKG